MIARIMVLLTACLGWAVSLYGQKSFSEGLIVYDVKVEEPLNAHARQTQEQFSGSKLELMVKNRVLRTDLMIGGIDRVVISNTQDTTAVVLLDRGPNKYLIRLTRSQVASELSPYANINFQDAHAIRQIAGYTCRKAEGKAADGDLVTIFYTSELLPVNPGYFPEYGNLKGMPLQVESKIGGLRMTLTASSVDLSPLPASDFDIPTTGYKEITEKDLQQMAGN